MADLAQILNDLAQAAQDGAKAAQELADLKFAEGKLAGDAEGYARGFEDGKKSVPASDKIFSQEEADKLVADAMVPLQLKINELQAIVDGIDAKIEQKVKEAVETLKAQMKSDMDALEEKYSPAPVVVPEPIPEPTPEPEPAPVDGEPKSEG